MKTELVIEGTIKLLLIFLLFGCSESSENSPKFKAKNIHDIEKHLN